MRIQGLYLCNNSAVPWYFTILLCLFTYETLETLPMFRKKFYFQHQHQEAGTKMEDKHSVLNINAKTFTFYECRNLTYVQQWGQKYGVKNYVTYKKKRKKMCALLQFEIIILICNWQSSRSRVGTYLMEYVCVNKLFYLCLFLNT